MSLHGRTLTVESVILRTRELLRGRSPAPLHGLADLSGEAASRGEDCTLRQHDRIAVRDNGCVKVDVQR